MKKSDYPKLKDRKVSETEIKKSIKSWLDRAGIFSFPVLQGLGSVRGIPDRIAIEPGTGRFIAIEVKTKNGAVSDWQRKFLDQVEASGGIAIIARSVDEVIDVMGLLKKPPILPAIRKPERDGLA